jgi:hypothetical protein
MSQPYEIAESNLLSASEAWEDYLSLRQALESEASTELLPVSAATRAEQLLREAGERYATDKS